MGKGKTMITTPFLTCKHCRAKIYQKVKGRCPNCRLTTDNSNTKVR